MLKFVVFAALIAVTFAAVALSPHNAKPDKFKDQEGCYITELDLVLPFGAKANSKEGCFQHSCGDKYVQLIGCGAVSPGPGCKEVTDASKPYPGCCPALSCGDQAR